MATPSQILANRSNARFSTGPSTPEGKLASSGVFAILPHEDRAAFDQLASTLRAEFLPKGDTETFLVDQMIQSRWKATRIERLEMEAFEQILTEPGSTDSPDGRILAAISTPGNVLDKLQRYAAAAERSYYKALREIQALRARAQKADAASIDTYIKKVVHAPMPDQKPPAQNKPNSPPANLALRL
jgi:hypothetical protein